MARTTKNKRLTEVERLAKRRDFYWQQAVGATDPVRRFGFASDYVKAVLSDLPDAQAADAATQITQSLFKYIDQLMGVKPQ